MSTDKNNINYTADDIRRYWQNEMSAAEMHALEKAAMEDPFLADAMEGYSRVAEGQETNLAALRARLTERTKRGVVVSIKSRNYWWRVAAAVVLIAGIGTLTVRYITDSNKRKEDLVANTQIPLPAGVSSEQAVPDSIVNALPADTTKYFGTGNDVALNTKRPESPGKQKNEIQGSIVNAERDSNAFLSGTSVPVASADKENAAKLEERLDGRAAGVRTDDRALQSRSNALLFNNFSGRVVDPNNNAIPMANVRMNNANVALTDQNGVFQFRSFDSVANVSIVSSGYSAREVNLAGNRAAEPIVLQVESDKKSKASEGYASPKKKSQTQTKNLNTHANDAQPANGWEAFEDYLLKNKKSPVKESTVTGEVVVTFRVDKDGNLSSFNIEKSLSKMHDAEAIRLIREGPVWMVTRGKKPRVRLAIPF